MKVCHFSTFEGLDTVNSPPSSPSEIRPPKDRERSSVTDVLEAASSLYRVTVSNGIATKIYISGSYFPGFVLNLFFHLLFYPLALLNFRCIKSFWIHLQSDGLFTNPPIIEAEVIKPLNLCKYTNSNTTALTVSSNSFA